MSSFTKPTLISSELALFLGQPEGTKLLRTDVAIYINAYVKDRHLHNPMNGREILPDETLIKLLKIPEGDQLTYFNLQKYLRHHFVRPEALKATRVVIRRSSRLAKIKNEQKMASGNVRCSSRLANK
jgi:chromatin remodeling complex protein RSC6